MTNDLYGCKRIPLPMHEDTRGYLVPVLGEVHPDAIYCYYSFTKVGAARDDNQWHYHEKQTDRFVVLGGCAEFALSDGKSIRTTLMDYKFPVILEVPPGVYHCFKNPSEYNPVLVLNLPTAIYDPSDEGRIPFTELGAGHPW